MISPLNAQKFSTAAEWELEKRKVQKGGFVAFCNAFGYKLARHHILMAEKLEKTITEPGYNLIICMPPGHAKSRYASILFPAYFLSLTGKSVVTSSHTAELAAKWGRAVKRLVGEDKYRFFFNASLRKDSQASDRFELTNGSEYFSCGILGGVAGQRADLTVLDDPVKSIEEADSLLIRDKIWDTFLSEFMTRAKPGASTVIIMTRRHEDDLIGRVLTSPKKEKWDLLSLPAIAEENDQLGRNPGEALWPEYIPLKMLEDFRDSLNKQDIRLWNSLYQQRPTIETGDYFKKEWIKTINKAPSNLHIYGSSDYAVTENGGDYTVHMIVGHDSLKDDIYILDVWRQQSESNVWIEKFIELALYHKPLVWAEEAGQILKSLDPFIRKEMEKRRCYVYREQFASATDKSSRARSIQAYMAQGHVYVLNAEWTDSFTRELLAFPNGKYDDQVDAFSLIGRMIDDMMVKKNKRQGSKTEYEYKTNMIMLPGLKDKIFPEPGGFKKI
jgi:predicted phage terminase large subunit-like protein